MLPRLTSRQRRNSAGEVISAFPPAAAHSQIVPELEPAADEVETDDL